MGPSKGLAIAIGVPKKGPEKESPDMLTSIAQDLIDAVKAGDAMGVADALRAAHDECASYEGEE